MMDEFDRSYLKGVLIVLAGIGVLYASLLVLVLLTGVSP